MNEVPTSHCASPTDVAMPRRSQAWDLSEMSEWRTAALILVLSWIVLLTLFRETSATFLEAWLHSNTYSHGFLILPASLYLAWDRRRQLTVSVPVPDIRLWPLLAVIGFGWVLGALVNVLVVQQLALVAMMIGLVGTVIGPIAIRQLILPLGFLFFAVPIGDELVPLLQDFTAAFTVTALKFSGVSVISEGRFFSLSSGDWVVVEGCSGVRYLIGSVVLGVLYSGIVYRSWTRRLAFILLSIIAPILANGLRAYSVVMISQYSSTALAADIDHLVYGWVFFGAVMVLLGWVGWVGLRWQELGEAELFPSADGPPTVGLRQRSTQLGMIQAAVGGLALLTLAPLFLTYANSDYDDDAQQLSQTAPNATKPWHVLSSSAEPWRPTFQGADAVCTQSYAADGKPVHLSIAQYVHQRQGAELVTSQQQGDRDDTEIVASETLQSIVVDGQPLVVHQTIVRSTLGSRVVWKWYWVGGQYTANGYYAKLLELQARLITKRRIGAAITIWTEYGDEKGLAENTMQDFLRHTSIKGALHAEA